MVFSSLSNNDVATLFASTRRDDARDEAIARYQLLVYSCVKRFRERDDFEDILQEGQIALVQALQAYKPEQGVFSTIAVHYINGKVRHYIRDKSHIVRHPSRVQDHYRKEMLARAALEAGFGRPPTLDEVADALAMSVDALEKFHKENPQQLGMVSLGRYQMHAENSVHEVARVPRTMMASLSGNAVDSPSLLDDDERAMLANSTVTEIARTYRIGMIDARRVKEYALLSQ